MEVFEQSKLFCSLTALSSNFTFGKGERQAFSLSADSAGFFPFIKGGRLNFFLCQKEKSCKKEVGKPKTHIPYRTIFSFFVSEKMMSKVKYSVCLHSPLGAMSPNSFSSISKGNFSFKAPLADKEKVDGFPFLKGKLLKNIAHFFVLLSVKRAVAPKSEQYFTKSKARRQDFTMKRRAVLI